MCDMMGAKLVDTLSKGELAGTTEHDKLNADPHELIEMTKTADSHI